MKSFISPILTLFISLLVLLGCDSKNIKPIEPGVKIGIILMHGKGGDTRWVSPLAISLRSSGVKVVVPNMAWHKNRIYDKTFNEAMAEINSHVREMKSLGIQIIYVAGHSLGAIAASGYAAQYNDIHGIILLAPGHFVGWPGFNRYFVSDLQIAESMINSEKGDKKRNFIDINSGKKTSRYITAKVFKSWFSDTGPAEFVSNMENIRGNIPVLYVAGSQDTIPQTQNKTYAFDKAPSNLKSEFHIIDSNHLNVPREADEVVIEWLRKP